MPRRLLEQLSLVPVAFLILGGCGRSGPGVVDSAQASCQQPGGASKPSQGDGIPPDQIGPIMEAHYRGLGFMERYAYREAVDAFREVHARAPNWISGSINLAIALMNDGRDGAETTEQARDLLNDVIAGDPKNLHAHYCRGLILESLGLIARAHADFQFVVENDPGDAHAWYMLGSTVDLTGIDRANEANQPEPIRAKLNEQITDFLKALQCNPYLTGAVYRLNFAYRSAGDRESARKQLDLWKRLQGDEETAGPGEYTVPGYGGMGRYAEVINPLVESKPRSSPIRPPRFEAPASLKVSLAAGDRWVAAADFTGRLAVIGRAQARFGAPIVAFDADGQVDLFLTGVGDNRLYHNQGPKGFVDVTKTAGISGPPALSLTARWLDLDQDGDLDLYVVNYTGLDHVELAFGEKTPPGLANSAFRNDGKPTRIPGRPPGYSAPRAVAPDMYPSTSGLSIALTPWTGSDALLGGIAAHTGLAALDLDDDHDLDLVLSAEGAVPRAILNDRLGRFHSIELMDIGPHAADSGLLATDFDQDGRPDLACLDPSGRVSTWQNQTRRDVAAVTLAFKQWPGNAGAWRTALATDLDLDGWPDLLGLPALDALPIPEWARNDGRRLSASPFALGPDDSASRALQAITLADLVGDALPDLILIKDGEGPRLARNRGNGHHWLALSLSGRWYPYGRLRTNPHGIGARVWLQGPGLNISAFDTTPDAGLAQSLVPITLGLGRYESAAVMRLTLVEKTGQQVKRLGSERRGHRV